MSEEPVLFYERRFYCFSNFSSFSVEVWGHTWPTSEHAYQAAKFGDRPGITKKIRNARSAHDAKIIARAYNQSMIHPGWRMEKLQVMEEICRAKLRQHQFIQECLSETGDREIIEDSPKDSFWGWGPDQKGSNHLGRIWMKLRAEMK